MRPRPIAPGKPAFGKLDVCLAVAVIALVAVVGLAVLAKRENSPSPLSASRAGSPGPSEPANATPASPDPAIAVRDAAAVTVSAPVPAYGSEQEPPGQPKEFGDVAFRRDLPQHVAEQNARLREEAIAEHDNPDRSALTLSLEEVDMIEQSGAVIQ